MQIGVEAQRAVENRRVFVVDEDDIDRTVLQFMLADADDAVVRPFKMEAVRRKVDRHLGRQVELRIPVAIA